MPVAAILSMQSHPENPRCLLLPSNYVHKAPQDSARFFSSKEECEI
jgi:hypothetical protein